MDKVLPMLFKAVALGLLVMGLAAGGAALLAVAAPAVFAAGGMFAGLGVPLTAGMGALAAMVTAAKAVTVAIAPFALFGALAVHTIGAIISVKNEQSAGAENAAHHQHPREAPSSKGHSQQQQPSQQTNINSDAKGGHVARHQQQIGQQPSQGAAQRT